MSRADGPAIGGAATATAPAGGATRAAPVHATPTGTWRTGLSTFIL
jgi:hypothetical protein